MVQTSAERESLSDAESFRLLDECRERKEALNPNTRRIVVDITSWYWHAMTGIWIYIVILFSFAAQ